MKIWSLILVFNALAAKAQDNYLAIATPIEYDGTELFLDSSTHPSKTLFVQNFLPKDESMLHFTKLLSFSYFKKDIDVEDAVQQKIKSLEQRTKSDRYATPSVTESPDGKELILDYMITETPEKESEYAEYNVYRFKKYESATQPAFLIINYAERIYGDNKSAAKAFKKRRNELIGALADYAIPSIAVTQEFPVQK